MQKNIKIAHLTHIGPRANIIINEGLIQLGYTFDLDRNFYINGETIKTRQKNILKEIKNYDIIFCGNSVYCDFIEENDIWNKIIWYDFEDSTEIENKNSLKSKLYFKRSVVTSDRKLIDLKRKNKSPINPIDYCAMNRYFLPEIQKTINISCFLDDNNINTRRGNLVNELRKKNILCQVTDKGSQARNAISKKYQPYEEYLIKLSKSKIVFTAFPEKQDGDSRIWESFASGALVCRDKTYIPTQNPYLDGEHCVIFDAKNSNSIKEAIEKAKYYLNHIEERMKIAQKGLEFTKQFHLAKNRVENMINLI